MLKIYKWNWKGILICTVKLNLCLPLLVWTPIRCDEWCCYIGSLYCTVVMVKFYWYHLLRNSELIAFLSQYVNIHGRIFYCLGCQTFWIPVCACASKDEYAIVCPLCLLTDKKEIQQSNMTMVSAVVGRFVLLSEAVTMSYLWWQLKWASLLNKKHSKRYLQYNKASVSF